MNNPGRTIKVARLMKGMSLERLSAYAGISLKELVLIEHDYKKASARQLFRLATILNIPHPNLALPMDVVEAEINESTLFQSGLGSTDISLTSSQRLILIIGRFYDGSRTNTQEMFSEKERVNIVEMPSANRSFALLGLGTMNNTDDMTPYLIILDTEIRSENYRQTTQAFHGVERLRQVPVFLTGAAPTNDLYKMSNRSNVYGRLARPKTPSAYKEQITGLLKKVEMLNNYF